METRERIITECSGLLRRVGPASMTMDDVAKACGISKRTLYETFHDKRSLITECIKLEHDIKNAEIDEIFKGSNNCFEALFQIYMRARKMYQGTSLAFANDLRRIYPELFNRHVENDKKTINGLAEVLHKAQEEGLVIQRINPTIAAYLFVASMKELHKDANLAQNYGLAVSDLFEHVFISFLRGISTIEGIELIEKLEKEHLSKNNPTQ